MCEQRSAGQCLREAGPTLLRVREALDAGEKIMEWDVAVAAAPPQDNPGDGRGRTGAARLNLILNAALVLAVLKLLYDAIFANDFTISLISVSVLAYAVREVYAFRRRNRKPPPVLWSVCHIAVNFDKKYFDIVDGETDLRDRLHRFQPDTELPAFNLPEEDGDGGWRKLRGEIQQEISRRTQCRFRDN
ncbi:MAG: hypothetical protein Q3966_03835 [Neisseria sp.]|nr:hypothetical protein [Neisseria sp.]